MGEVNDKVKSLIPEEKLKEYQELFSKIIQETVHNQDHYLQPARATL